jgi:hypothetical protein
MHTVSWNKRKPPKKAAAEFKIGGFRLVVSGVPNCVLDVPRDVVRGTLGLIDLAFRLKLLVTGQLAGCILDGALHLIGGALHMFTIHVPFSIP